MIYKRLGFLLVLIGLLTGFISPHLANPRLGLSAHLAGTIGGIFLIVIGLVVPSLVLGERAMRTFKWAWIYTLYANWLACLIGAATGASRFTPIAGADTTGSDASEFVVAALLISLSVTAIAGCVLGLWGLRERKSA